MEKKAIENTTRFKPQYDENGLIPCITKHYKTGEILMFAWMNQDSLNKTIALKEMVFWSRSRKELWHKGATSGNILNLKSLHIDCDQDCLLAIVGFSNSKNKAACHTGQTSCFYREIDLEKSNTLIFNDDA